MLKDKSYYSTFLLSILILLGFVSATALIGRVEYKYLSAILFLVFSLIPILDIDVRETKEAIIIKHLIIVAPVFLIYLIGILIGNNLSISFLLISIILGILTSYFLLKRNFLLRLGIPIILSYFVFTGFQFYYSELKLSKSLINIKADQSVSLVSKDSVFLDLTSSKDKLTVLEFWNSACGNCIRDFPKFQKFYNQNKEKYDIYSVNVPHKRDIKTGFNPHSFIDSLGYSFPILKSSQEDMVKLKGRAYPTVIVIDKNNRIRYSGVITYPTENSRYNFTNILEKIDDENL